MSTILLTWWKPWHCHLRCCHLQDSCAGNFLTSRFYFSLSMLTTVLKCTHFFLLICGVFWDFCLPVNAQDGHLVKSCTKLKNSCKNASPPPSPENTTLSQRKSKLYHHIRSTFAGSKSITERNTDFLFRFPKNGYGGGNGNPLQYSCLESPRGGGAWWAAVYGVAQNWTLLKWLSSKNG